MLPITKMHCNKLFVSRNVVLEDKIVSGGVLVGAQGKIVRFVDYESFKTLKQDENIKVIDVGDHFLMPGVIDSHVHVNEPGRTEWEGFETATKAAAAGGITTIVDMPLNSIPPTTTLENFKQKVSAAENNAYVDVAFWGGLVPNNVNELLRLLEAGVVGFKCFLCPSGVREFQHVNFQDVENAIKVLENTSAVLAFHAEIEEETPVTGNPTHYETYLNSRADSMEVNAIKGILELAEKYNIRIHIVHLSSALTLPLIEQIKKGNPNISVETCHHYLKLNSEDIPNKATQFKCCPPIRDKKNQEKLWDALKRDVVDMVVSDHSPCTPDLKLLKPSDVDYGNFIKAWGGISSVQFGLLLFWSESRKRGLTIFDLRKYLTERTSKLVGLHTRKGRISQNYDADFVIWDPNATTTIEETIIHHKNKVTPYLGMKLAGRIFMTVIRGEIVYENEGEIFKGPFGKLLINETFMN